MSKTMNIGIDHGYYNMETGTKYGGSAIDEYIATQILIWLIAHNQLGTGYESQIVNEITANSPAAKPIFYTLRENVMNYRTIPPFATDDPGAVGAYTHALQYNESTGKNETTLVKSLTMRDGSWPEFLRTMGSQASAPRKEINLTK